MFFTFLPVDLTRKRKRKRCRYLIAQRPPKVGVNSRNMGSMLAKFMDPPSSHKDMASIPI